MGQAAGLWDFTLRFYGAPGVAEACLALQDRHEADVTLLIFAAWVGADQRALLDTGKAEAAAEAVADWHAEIVRPLRAVRRRMKVGPGPAPSPQTEALRDKLKAVEVGAEKIELQVLERFSQPPGELPVDQAVRANLRTMLARTAGANLPDGTAAALEVLVAAAAELQNWPVAAGDREDNEGESA